MSTALLQHDEYGKDHQRDTVIFMHGGNSCRLEWRGIIEPLASEYHVLAVDAPGHGQSLEARPWSLSRPVTMHVDLLQAKARNGKAHLVGFSKGGYTALALAKEYPHLVQSIFISGVEDLQTAWPWWKLRLAVFQHLPFYIVPKAVHIGHMQYMGMKGMNSDLYNAMKRAGNATGQNFSDLVNMRLPPISQPMEWQLAIPTLAIAGAKNDSVPTTQALADELARGNARSHLVVIQGGVHWWGLQYPEVFTKLVHDWLQKKDIPVHIDPSSFIGASRTVFH